MDTLLNWHQLGEHASAGHGGLGYTLRCAARVYVTTGRHAPEGKALATWMQECADALGLDEADLPDDGQLAPRRGGRGVPIPAWHMLGAALAASLQAARAAVDGPAALWLAAFTRALGLDPIEAAILSLVLHYYTDTRVERLLDMLSNARGGAARLQRDPALIGLLLGAEPAEVEARLGSGGRLLDGGLLRVDRDGDLTVLSRLATLVRGASPPGDDLYAQLLGDAVGDGLPWEAFAHLGRQAVVAAEVLRAALAGREPGIHLLLYGPPGTGKTSFAASLAARIGARLRSVTECDDAGAEPNRRERLSGLQLGQRLAPPGELLLFDEAEDLFLRTGQPGHGPVASRVFMHRLLEQGAVPVIWTANDIGALGPAVLRRMTLCLELRVPDVAIRARLWRGMGEAEGIPLTDADAARLARLVPAAPAVASSALRAARLAGGGADTARLVVEGVARAVAGGCLPPPEPEPDAGYDPALVNADRDLAGLAACLGRPGATRAVSFLLSGPPGTGKTAWARHLAGCLGLEVLQKRASDLLDPYVGGTEQRIAAAFVEAREAGAFLLFDEADSLLLDRADAVRSWEVSQVNEMLTWMEQHPLPFACTTNLVDRLDRASLRRFLVKVRFGWLTAAQARLAFRCFFGVVPSPGLDGLATLTPADFALVRRRVAITGDGSDAEVLLGLLAAECEGRVGGRVAMGFGVDVNSDNIS
jgi:transitional endoplasmic reticulum ATPase